MKKILVMMFAVLFVSTMGMAVCNDAWAEASATSEGSSKAQSGSEQTKDSTYKSSSFNGAAFMNNMNNGSGSWLNRAVTGAIGGFSTNSANSNAGSFVQNVSSSFSSTTTVSGGGLGGGFGSAIGIAGGTAMSVTSNLAGIVVGKLSNIFLDVKTILYVLAAFGLVGFAFMALFGKVRWGWVCALAFGLAAVSAAGQLIDYVSNGGVSSVTADTLGTNMY